MITPQKVFIAGHRGMVGSAIERAIRARSKYAILTRTRHELDLTNQSAVNEFFRVEKPDQVYLAAAMVGGIIANSVYPADFISQNLLIQTNVIKAAHENDVKRLLFLGSSCIYPKFASQPIRESELLAGPLEITNEPYAIAKIAGLKLCESYRTQFGCDFRSAMPTNLYGPGDNYHHSNSHVIPGLLRRFHDAKLNNSEEVTVWGSGSPRREFLYVNDLADGCIFLMELDNETYNSVTTCNQRHINIGFGEDITIAELANKMASIVGFQGRIKFDLSKPDGTPQKLLDSSIISKLGWRPKVSLHEGLRLTYDNFLSKKDIRL